MNQDNPFLYDSRSLSATANGGNHDAPPNFSTTNQHEISNRARYPPSHSRSYGINTRIFSSFHTENSSFGNNQTYMSRGGIPTVEDQSHSIDDQKKGKILSLHVEDGKYEEEKKEGSVFSSEFLQESVTPSQDFRSPCSTSQSSVSDSDSQEITFESSFTQSYTSSYASRGSTSQDSVLHESASPSDTFLGRLNAQPIWFYSATSEDDFSYEAYEADIDAPKHGDYFKDYEDI